MPRRAIAGVVVMLMLVGAAPAMAQEPAGCGGNLLNAGPLKNRTFIRDGETINYTVRISNDVPGSCDVTSLVAYLQLPSPTGEPSATLTAVNATPTWLSGAAPIVYGPWPYTVHFGPTPPARYTARLSGSGKLHDVPAPYSDRELQGTVQTLTVQPALTVDKVGSTTGGAAPQTVTYTYTVKNTTPSAGLPDSATAISNLVPDDDRCRPLRFTGGDANTDGKLNVTETWTYTCTQTFNDPGTYTNTVKVCGDNTADNVSMRYCAPLDTWTVTVTPPPGTPPTTPDTTTTPATPSTPSTPNTPVGQVLPATQTNPPSATKPSACLATPNRVRVRAKELTTIRVKVNGATAGTLVTVTGPGVKRTARTDSSGVATVRVKPTRSGMLTIKTASCSNARRVSVLAARRTASRQVPKVTG